MPQFTWSQKYSVNNEELDNHHKKLFDMFNRLYDNQLLIDELLSYADYHFKAEEQYMTDTGYKHILNHKEMHRYFIERVMEMKQVKNKNDFGLTKDLIVFLGNWLARHVLEEDQKYKI